jgi:exopolyphosphatase/guanosine-5'-triphosphate,3'-diphosphate pyrophosphatase
LPRKRHTGFASLPREKRRLVRVLAGCLRLADSLDRSHRQVVRRLAVTDRGSVIRVRCEVEGDCELELWGAGRRTDLLEHELGVPVRVDAQAAAPLAAVHAERA